MGEEEPDNDCLERLTGVPGKIIAKDLCKHLEDNETMSYKQDGVCK